MAAKRRGPIMAGVTLQAIVALVACSVILTVALAVYEVLRALRAWGDSRQDRRQDGDGRD